MISKYRKICVTGGAGFIGSHIVDRLIKERYEVIVIDNLSYGKRENIEHNFGNKDFQFINCDIGNSESLKSSIKEVDVILHEAALTNVKLSIIKPTLTNSINVTGTLNLLEAALNSNVKLFIYASSTAVYGNVSTLQSEDMPTRPLSPYGASKLAAENYVKAFHEAYDLQTICLRYFNVYGPRQSIESPYSGVISKFIGRLLRNEPLIIYGDGRQSRDFIHVQDVVEANLLALENEKAIGEIFNVGTGKSTSINELGGMLLKIINKDRVKIVHAKARRGDITHSCADITKARKVLGFNPTHTLEYELPKLFEWYKNKATKDEMA